MTPPKAQRGAATPANQNDAASKPGAKAKDRTRRYVRQKASFEGRRDKSPVILNYGRHLPAAQKTRIQQRLYWAFAGTVVALIIGVLVFGVINQNIIQPGQPIESVNGTNISQHSYKVMVAYLAQDNWNQLQADQSQLNVLQSDPAKQSANATKISSLQVTISTLTTSYTQTQIDQLALDRLTEDQLIQAGAARFTKSDPNFAAYTVTQKQVNDAFTAFKKAFPPGETYSQFISKDGISNQDVQNAIKLIVRRTDMDNYMQSLVKTPLPQVHAERIQFDNLAKANTDLAILKKDLSKWAALAKSDSLDVDTRDNSGDLGWFPNLIGSQDQIIEQWAFSAKPGQMSGVFKDVSGTYEIVRLLAYDPAHALDPSSISALKSNALSHWLTGRRALAKISPQNNDMFNSADNVPVLPNLSAATGSTGTQTTPTTTSP